MGVGIFLIAIMGCGEGEAPCQPIRLLDQRYESQAQCTAATEAALAAHIDADFPVIVAQCHRAGKPPMLGSGAVILPSPEPTTLFRR